MELEEQAAVEVVRVKLYMMKVNMVSVTVMKVTVLLVGDVDASPIVTEEGETTNGEAIQKGTSIKLNEW